MAKKSARFKFAQMQYKLGKIGEVELHIMQEKGSLTKEEVEEILKVGAN